MLQIKYLIDPSAIATWKILPMQLVTTVLNTYDVPSTSGLFRYPATTMYLFVLYEPVIDLFSFVGLLNEVEVVKEDPANGTEVQGDDPIFSVLKYFHHRVLAVSQNTSRQINCLAMTLTMTDLDLTKQNNPFLK